MNWGDLFGPKNDDFGPNLLPKKTLLTRIGPLKVSPVLRTKMETRVTISLASNSIGTFFRGYCVNRTVISGMIPMLGQVMSATRGATDAFSGVSKHVNGALTKFGAKSIEAGIGCGVGFGHGFGVGLPAKPGMLHQIQCCVIETMAKLMMKFGKAPRLPFIGGAFPVSFRSGWITTNEPSRNPLGNMNQIVSKLADSTSQGLPGPGITSRGSTFGTRTEKVLSSFLQNPVFNDDETSQNELAARLPTENNMLQLVMPLICFATRFWLFYVRVRVHVRCLVQNVMKHQHIIELLMEENRKLHQILTEDLNIPTSKLQTGYLCKTESPCSDCFFCRRKQRRNRQ
ncbi:hypothetical protein CXB51_007499 [Gossypium anomalum]|uniref:Uncharacterized protein n=1 Tax=Gossypium anomalum TaxID=47600 RepID=A0A8J5ZDD3_9ROSI|nr:hypothetical protein CXB51_007499 [Gossypium anomalum]